MAEYPTSATFEAQLAQKNAARALGEDPVDRGMTSVAKKINEMDGSIRDVLKQVVASLSSIRNSFSDLSKEQSQALKDAVVVAHERFLATQESMGGVTGEDVDQLAKSLSEAIVAIEKERGEVPDRIATEMEPLREAAQQFAGALQEATQEAESSAEEVQDAAEVLAKVVPSVPTAATDWTAAPKAGPVDRLIEAIEEKMVSKMDKMEKSLKELNEKTVPTLTEYLRSGLGKLGKELGAGDLMSSVSAIAGFLLGTGAVFWKEISSTLDWIQKEGFEGVMRVVREKAEDLAITIWDYSPDWLRTGMEGAAGVGDVVGDAVLYGYDTVAEGLDRLYHSIESFRQMQAAQRKLRETVQERVEEGGQIGSYARVLKEKGEEGKALAYSEMARSAPRAAAEAWGARILAVSGGATEEEAFRQAQAVFKEQAYSTGEIAPPKNVAGAEQRAQGTWVAAGAAAIGENAELVKTVAQGIREMVASQRRAEEDRRHSIRSAADSFEDVSPPRDPELSMLRTVVRE